MRNFYRLPYLLFALVLCYSSLNAQWLPQGERIKTQWAATLQPDQVLQAYPRPMMTRPQWENLNGLWDYAIRPENETTPHHFDGKILVPFAVESSLSGVQKRLDENQLLWYQHEFSINKNWKGKNILLHFGAVDWKTEVWINDIKIGDHQGGYDPFSFDITPFLNNTAKQKIVVKVWDPSDKGYQPRGKQTSEPRGIWYTPVTGIWQTVWLEAVPKTHIQKLEHHPDLDRQSIVVSADLAHSESGDYLEVIVRDQGKIISRGKGVAHSKVAVSVPNPHLWNPDDPFLYDLEVRLLRKDKVLDAVGSYFAMRKISMQRDAQGIVRLQLNNKNYFQFGPLDQGWWPDGLYTAPSDEALRYDIQKTKDFGFNMIRKHVKVEPARWYYHCDQLGMLVWQDMPNGDRTPLWQNKTYFDASELKRSPESEANFRKEWKNIMDALRSHPSIVCWVPFNEGWGQFKTEEIVQWTKTYDPTRLVNPASGGNHFPVGDMLDLHNYPHPEMYLFDGQRANVLGEYGGIGLALEGHLWQPDRNWGYVQFKDSKAVTDQYVAYAEELYKMIASGFSAAIYTQTTDVEVEVNGLMTYDRKVIKLEEDRLRAINQKIVHALDNN